MQTVDSGELRQRVTIQLNTPVLDAANQSQPSWSDYKTRWAHIDTVAGGDYIQSAQIRNSCTHVVTMRYLPELAAKIHQIVYQGRIFNIVSVVSPEERHVMTVAYCKEVE